MNTVGHWSRFSSVQDLSESRLARYSRPTMTDSNASAYLSNSDEPPAGLCPGRVNAVTILVQRDRQVRGTSKRGVVVTALRRWYLYHTLLDMLRELVHDRGTCLESVRLFLQDFRAAVLELSTGQHIPHLVPKHIVQRYGRVHHHKDPLPVAIRREEVILGWLGRWRSTQYEARKLPKVPTYLKHSRRDYTCSIILDTRMPIVTTPVNPILCLGFLW